MSERKNYYVKKTYYCPDCLIRHKPNSRIGLEHRTPQERKVFGGEWCINCRGRFTENSDITFVIWGDGNLLSYRPIHVSCVDDWLASHEHYRLVVRELTAKFILDES